MRAGTVESACLGSNVTPPLCDFGHITYLTSLCLSSSVLKWGNNNNYLTASGLCLNVLEHIKHLEPCLVPRERYLSTAVTIINAHVSNTYDHLLRAGLSFRH